MVRVFNCHHFTSQDVLPTEAEPTAILCQDNRLFVATDNCQIMVFGLEKKPYRQISTFPTLESVDKLVYSDKAHYIGTLEESRRSDKYNTYLRVYMGWQDSSGSEPMRVGVAGHMTSLRHESHQHSHCSSFTPEVSKLHVVEIPLKGKPETISIDPSTGNFAVVVYDHVLVYGLCCKTVASSNKNYHDFKCLLDLEFVFRIRYLSICEDFVLCCSRTQCQIIKLNSDISEQNSLDSDVKPVSDASQNENDQTLHKLDDPQKEKDLDHLINWIKLEDYVAEQTKYIVTDPNCIIWNMSSMNETGYSYHTNGVGESLPSNIYLPSIHGKETPRSRHGEPGLQSRVVLGPTTELNMPVVTVQYEDSCSSGEDLRGLIDGGTTSYLFCSLDSSKQQQFIEPALLPVYKPQEDGDSPGELAGMFCLLSTSKEGYLYQLTPQSTKFIAAYPYAANVLQVAISGDKLYAMSENAVEVYTCHCVTKALSPTTPSKIVRCPVLGPCMLGLQSFMGLDSMTHSDTNLVLLSKILGDGEATCWSLYLLQKPTNSELHSDMMELASSYHSAHVPAYEELLLQDHLLLQAHRCYHGNSLDIDKHLSESCLKLGMHYTGCEAPDSGLAEHYLSQSGHSPEYILSVFVDLYQKELGSKSVSQIPGPVETIIKYLDDIILTKNCRSTVSKEGAELVASFYSRWSPYKLPLILLMVDTSSDLPKLLKSHCKGNIGKELEENSRLKSLYDVVHSALLLRSASKLEAGEIMAQIPSEHVDQILSLLLKLTDLEIKSLWSLASREVNT